MYVPSIEPAPLTATPLTTSTTNSPSIVPGVVHPKHVTDPLKSKYSAPALAAPGAISAAATAADARKLCFLIILSRFPHPRHPKAV